MEENTNAKINELNEKNINLGGQSLQDDAKEDVQAVKEGNKTVDMVERLMSREEILEAAKKNSLYANMISPCLAGNVSLDGKLLEFLRSPMKPVDLEEHINTAMNVLVYEISREQNGLVFNSNGTLNVHQSIQQAVSAGIPVTSALRDTMIESTMNRIQNAYERQNEVGLNAVIKTTDVKISVSDFEKLFDKSMRSRIDMRINVLYNYENSKGDFRKNKNDAIDSVKKLLDGKLEEARRLKEEIEKEEFESKRNDAKAQKRIAELRYDRSARGHDLDNDEVKAVEQEENQRRMEEHERIKALKERLLQIETEIATITQEKIAIEGLSDADKFSLDARLDQAEVNLVKYFSPSVNATESAIRKREEELRNNAENKLDEDAMTYEKYSNDLLKVLIKGYTKQNVDKFTEYREKVTESTITDEEKTDFLMSAIKTYYIYNRLSDFPGNNIADLETVNVMIREVRSDIGNLIPNSVTPEGRVDERRIIDYLRRSNLIDPKKEGNTLQDLIGGSVVEELTEDLTAIRKMGLDKSILDEVKEETVLDNEFLVNSDKEYIINAYNVLRTVREYSTENSMFKFAGQKIKKAKMDAYIEDANEAYDQRKDFYEEKAKGYMRDRVLKNFGRFRVLENHDDLHLLSNEEKAKQVSWAIIGYQISEDRDDSISKEIRGKSNKIIKEFLGEDVYKDDGTLDEQKFTEAYINFSKVDTKTAGKYGLMGRDSNYEGILNMHLKMGYHEVERTMLLKLAERVNIARERLPEITNEEAKQAVDEKGEELDDSAIKQPVQDKKEKKVVSDKQITQEEGDKAMKTKGENLHVAETPVKEKTGTNEPDKSVDKTAEEMGNSVAAENIVLDDNDELLPVKQEPKTNAFIENIKKLAKDVMDIFKSIFTGKDSNNSGSTSSSGGSQLEDNQEKNVQQQTLVQTVTLNVQQAQIDAKNAKEKMVLEQGKNDEMEQGEK